MYLKKVVFGLFIFACVTGVWAQNPTKVDAEKMFSEAETLRKNAKS